MARALLAAVLFSCWLHFLGAQGQLACRVTQDYLNITSGVAEYVNYTGRCSKMHTWCKVVGWRSLAFILFFCCSVRNQASNLRETWGLLWHSRANVRQLVHLAVMLAYCHSSTVEGPTHSLRHWCSQWQDSLLVSSRWLCYSVQSIQEGTYFNCWETRRQTDEQGGQCLQYFSEAVS